MMRKVSSTTHIVICFNKDNMASINVEEFETRLMIISAHTSVITLLSIYTGPLTENHRRVLLAWSIDAARQIHCWGCCENGSDFTPLAYVLTDERFEKYIPIIVRRMRRCVGMYKEFLSS